VLPLLEGLLALPLLLALLLLPTSMRVKSSAIFPPHAARNAIARIETRHIAADETTAERPRPAGGPLTVPSTLDTR